MKQRIGILLLILVGLWATWSLTSPGLPLTHDSQNHLARMANYYLALKEGQIPPRWAPNLMNGLGYPVFNFNYPLANIVALPMITLNLSVQQSYKLITISALVMSGIGMFLLVSKLTSTRAGIMSALVYMLNPYQLQLIFVRGVIGESLAIALLPWIFYLWLAFEHKNSSKNFLLLTGSLAAFWLSHNILVLFSLPIVFGFGWWRIWANKRIWQKLVLPLALSLGLVSFFWIPALWEKQWTVLDQVDLSENYRHHFPTLNQLFYSATGHGFSRPGPVDGLSFSLGLTQWLIVGISLIQLLTSHRKSKTGWFLLGLVTLTIAIMMRQSLPVWELIPVFRYIQFPWRLLFLTQFLIALLLGWLVRVKAVRFRGMTVLVALSVLFVSTGTSNNNWFNHTDDYWFSFPESTSILDENRSIHLNKPEAYASLSNIFSERVPVFEHTPDDFSLKSRTGTKTKYFISNSRPVRVTEPKAYFPGWLITLSNGQTIVPGPNPEGLVQYTLPAGTYEVTSYFSQRTPARQVGNGLTALAMIGTVVGSTVLMVDTSKSDRGAK